MKRVLILTASMGEGHNTAARNIRDAIVKTTGGQVAVEVSDPYTRTNPVVNRLMQRGYTMAINRYPRAWKVLFNLLSRPGVVEGMGPMLAELTAAVRAMVADYKPDILVSTYPVFSYIVAKIRKRNPATPPLYTVITDSTMINSAWYRWPCNGFLVADDATASVLTSATVPQDVVHVTGFPVHPSFDALTPCSAPTDGRWKVVFFPGGSASRALGTLQGLAGVPEVEVLVVTGRRQGIHKAIKAAGLPKKGSLVGWTDRMPEIMAEHHVFVGKAGGATVQEAIAAQIPFVVSHVVPGQEEGNIALIERSGIGTLGVGQPSRIADVLRGVIANDGALWHAWRANLAKVRKPGAAQVIAEFVMSRV